jgi:hypothetical protein
MNSMRKRSGKDCCSSEKERNSCGKEKSSSAKELYSFETERCCFAKERNNSAKNSSVMASYNCGTGHCSFLKESCSSVKERYNCETERWSSGMALRCFLTARCNSAKKNRSSGSSWNKTEYFPAKSFVPTIR